MAKDPDPLAKMSSHERALALARLCDNVFGEHHGKRIFDKLASALAFKARQIGDAKEPQDNYWKGIWRIYELK